MARHHRKQSRKASRKAGRKARRSQKQKQSRKARRQQGGAQCAAIPLQNAVFAQRGGMAPYEVAGSGLMMDKAAMVQAQSYDQLGMLQEAGRLAAAAQHGGRRHRSRRHRRSQKKSRKQRGGMSPFDADTMLLPKSAYPFTGVNPQWTTEASVQPALRMGAGPQAA